jgi:transposase
MARPHKTVRLTTAQRETLESWIRAGNTPKKLVDRAQIILLFDQGQTASEVAGATGFSYVAVCRWRNRWDASGLAGLQDKPRPGQPRKLSSAKSRKILTMTVEQIPRESTHWSLRLMARYAGVTVHQVRQVWKAADLKPHRLKNFKISRDPQFAEKVQDVVGLYLDPPDNSMVLSVDEKTQIQALDRTQPMLPLKPGQAERRTHDYKRNGTRSLYAAFDVATGQVRGRVTKQHRAREFLAFLRQIDRTTPRDLDLHLIVDNSSTHKTPEVKRWLERHPRFHMHFTPTSASWLNAVESWFSQLERRALYRGIFTNVLELRDEIHRYIRIHNNEHAKPFRWTKSAEAIIEKRDDLRRRFLDGTNQTAH